MGWNSWNAFGSGNTAALTRTMADKMVELAKDVDLKVIQKFSEPFTLLYECLKDFSFHPATIKTMLSAEGNTVFKTGKHIARKEKGKLIVTLVREL